ncbi:hypothetical protein GCM10009839_84390 [Catenulispora yoronensis]|uniref:Uncharacterized protein n=1 Tax=Catenulispora yoronensis TaxID=450799 RepID=A0ABP5GYK9_9ACTN
MRSGVPASAERSGTAYPATGISSAPTTIAADHRAPTLRHKARLPPPPPPPPPTPGSRSRSRSTTTARHNNVPDNATANVTNGAPPTAANGVNGESGCENASRPHENPPNGHRDRTASSATHRHACHSGANRAIDTRAMAHPNGMKYSDSMSPTASCAPGPKTRRNWNITQQNPVPNQNPMSMPRRPLRPANSADTAATINGATGHHPTGANARFSTAPASSANAARRTASRLGRRRNHRRRCGPPASSTFATCATHPKKDLRKP